MHNNDFNNIRDVIDSLNDNQTYIIDEYVRHQPLKGPSPYQLEKSKALQNAWNEFKLIWELIGNQYI